MGLLAFLLSIVAAAMSFFQVTKLPSFVFGIFAVIFATVAAYQTSKAKEKNKDSQALEVGAVINSGAVCLSYLILLWF